MDENSITLRLSDWRKLTQKFSKLSEEELSALLTHEKANAKRPSFLHKIHQRMNALRRRREVQELHKIGKRRS